MDAFDICQSCVTTDFEFIMLCMKHDNTNTNQMLYEWLQRHGVLAPRIEYPTSKEGSPKQLCEDTEEQGTSNGTEERKQYDDASLLKGTFFYNVGFSVETICEFVTHWLSRDPPRLSFIGEELKLSKASFFQLSALCRTITLEWAKKNSTDKLGGPGKIVEIDLAKFQKRKRHIEDASPEHWVFGGVQRDNKKKVFFVSLQNIDDETLVKIVKDNIVPGSTIISDDSLKFRCLEKEKFVHIKVKGFVDPTNKDAHCQNITRIWREVRTKVPVTEHKDMEASLSEFLFKNCFPDHTERKHHFFRTVGDLYKPESVERDCVEVSFPFQNPRLNNNTAFGFLQHFGRNSMQLIIIYL